MIKLLFDGKKVEIDDHFKVKADDKWVKVIIEHVIKDFNFDSTGASGSLTGQLVSYFQGKHENPIHLFSLSFPINEDIKNKIKVISWENEPIPKYRIT